MLSIRYARYSLRLAFIAFSGLAATGPEIAVSNPCAGILRIDQFADNRDASCEAPNAPETRLGIDIARFVPNLNESLYLDQSIDSVGIFYIRQPKA
jgi:hypothetical protein